MVASNAFTHDDLRRTMALLVDGRVRATPLHSRTVALAELEPTLRSLAQGDATDVKVLVDPERRVSGPVRKTRSAGVGTSQTLRSRGQKEESSTT